MTNSRGYCDDWRLNEIIVNTLTIEQRLSDNGEVHNRVQYSLSDGWVSEFGRNYL